MLQVNGGTEAEIAGVNTGRAEAGGEELVSENVDGAEDGERADPGSGSAGGEESTESVFKEVSWKV